MTSIKRTTTSSLYLAMLTTIFLLFPFFFLLWKKVQKSTCTTREAPEPRGAWPIVGHVPLLFGKLAPTHRILAGLADRWGPLITLRIGTRRLLVVSSSDMARECFTTNDRALGSRPFTTVGRHLGFNYASFGLAPSSPTWRHTRKLAVQELLSAPRLESLHHIWVSEVDSLVKELHALGMEYHAIKTTAPVVVDVKAKLWALSFNVITRMVAGKRHCSGAGVESDEGRRFRRVAGEVLRLLSVPCVGDAFPCLKWLDWKYEMDLRKTAMEVDSIMQGWLEERQGVSDKEQVVHENRDLMEVLISLGKGGQLINSDYSVDTIIKATSFTLITAGSLNISIELTWALSLLINNPRVLKRAHEELDTIVGRDRVVGRSDLKRLEYLQAIIKETLRLYPVAPLLVVHEAIEDCKLGEAHVPAGTRMLVNVWKIQRDPEIWSNPDEFRPERFMERHVDVDVLGRHFELLPFGSGRRSCVGTAFALEVMQLALARLVHEFDLSTPFGDPVDVSEGFSFSLPKLSPLDLVVKPRLSPTLYH